MVVGYSMGSWVTAVAGPADARVKARVLMVGGATELPPAALLIPQAAAAAEPKELIWYDCGYLLAEDAYDKAAEWTATLP